MINDTAANTGKTVARSPMTVHRTIPIIYPHRSSVYRVSANAMHKQHFSYVPRVSENYFIFYENEEK